MQTAQSQIKKKLADVTYLTVDKVKNKKKAQQINCVGRKRMRNNKVAAVSDWVSLTGVDWTLISQT
jgi:hypothetical protein